MSSKKDNSEKAFELMCKIIIVSIITITLLGITAIVAGICVGRNPEWTIPVKIVGGENE